MTRTEIAGLIQHTLYDVGTGPDAVRRHCSECVEYGFAAAMVPARFVGVAVTALAGSGVAVATAVDYPNGMMTQAGRIAEATAAVDAGADQIDIGVPVGLLRDGLDAEFERSIADVVAAAHPVEIKVMLEMPLLTAAEAERAVRLSIAAGAQWLKNASSGAIGVATPEQIRFLRARAPTGVRVKASGGISTIERVRELITAGADLVGTSSGVAIVTGTELDTVGFRPGLSY